MINKLQKPMPELLRGPGPPPTGTCGAVIPIFGHFWPNYAKSPKHAQNLDYGCSTCS